MRVLDHGFINCVETWGSDERIVEAARMSTGKGFLGWGPRCSSCGGDFPCLGCGNAESHKPGDEKLLAYLYDNRHSTPFEMGGLIIEVQAPIFVFREWHRHRTQCLAGDAEITCVTPTDTTFKRTIKELFDLKHGGVVDQAPSETRNGVSKAGTPVWREARRKNPWRVRVLPNCQQRLLRVLDEETGLFTVANMADVWESGIKPIFELRAGKRAVKASAEHPFLTRRGWVKTKDIRAGDEVARMGKVAANERPIPPALRQGIGVWTTMMRARLIPAGRRYACHLCGEKFDAADLELDHVVPVSLDLKLALDVDNLSPACAACHRGKTEDEQPSREGMSRRGVRWETVESLPSFIGEEMTYDIEVDGAHHNYCANDLVVHNSYNEMSARYTPLPDLNYVPTVERLMFNAGTTNKQAGTVSGAGVLTEAKAEAFRTYLQMNYEADEGLYQDALKNGIPKELARIHLPVGRYSRMRASANLRNWLGFLTLRSHPAAQYEIRVYAEAVADILRQSFPRTMALFDKGKTA